MGGLWVDYNLMSTVPGLYVLGEANFSDHGANRLGASALMQGLADGYFVIPYTIGDYLTTQKPTKHATSHTEFKKAEAECRARVDRLLSIDGKRSPDDFHRELGRLTWDLCGMSRSQAGLERALVKIPELREQFWKDVRVLGTGESLNVSLEKAGRVADFFEFAELLCTDALARDESCGGHFREEHQTEDGEAKRNDAAFSHVSVWEYKGVGEAPVLHKEPLTFTTVKLATRSYK
jgi:succinate dehydrogenase / fumarate reductase flavoprotein subunit